LKLGSSLYVGQLDLKIAKLKEILENPGCPYPGQPTFLGTGEI
jgi:hypothetical protein